jgi:hypothetical protein
MAALRTRRKATKKTTTPRRKKSPAKPKTRAGARRRGARARVSAVKGKARAIAGKVRAIGSGLAAGVSAAVQALRPGPLPPSPELNGALTEEERIESSKYLPRHAPKRLFETERFVFPETYGVNRVRLLVKDPEWLFAHWDVDPDVFASVRRDLGERAVTLSRLTLRVSDPVEGGATTILLPKGVRGWYVRADEGHPRSYRAELGITLPTGEFRALAASNTVGTPRVGHAKDGAQVRVRFDRSGGHVAEAARAGGARGGRTGRMAEGRVVAEHGRSAPEAGRGAKSEGGASDAFRPGGASDVFRR